MPRQCETERSEIQSHSTISFSANERVLFLHHLGADRSKWYWMEWRKFAKKNEKRKRTIQISPRCEAKDPLLMIILVFCFRLSFRTSFWFFFFILFQGFNLIWNPLDRDEIALMIPPAHRIFLLFYWEYEKTNIQIQIILVNPVSIICIQHIRLLLFYAFISHRVIVISASCCL